MALATQVRLTISSASQGNKRLRAVKSSKVTDGAKTQAVTALGEDDPIGFTDSPGPKTIALSVYQEQGTPEVDYDTLKTTKEVFTLTRAIVNGKRFQFTGCRVSSVEPDDDNEGSHMLSVEIVALRMRPL
jgi:hypothetical protein